MCGRHVSTRSPQDLAQPFHVAQWPTTKELAPSWNIAPTNDVWAVLERAPRDEGGAAAPVRVLRALRWGRVPSWAEEPKTGARMINAQVEPVHEKPAFRRAFRARRCRRLLRVGGVRTRPPARCASGRTSSTPKTAR